VILACHRMSLFFFLEVFMEETIVLFDAGFLSKLSKHFGKGNYIKYDIIEFAKRLAINQNLFCKKIFYYNAPPFQSERPTEQEAERFRKYEKFIEKISKDNLISIKEGRCQRLKINNNFIYKQKAVDSLVIIDLMSVVFDFPGIKKIILIASDSDFVPVIKKLKDLNIKTILYTYYQGGRKAMFSTSNELIKSVNKYVLLTKQDFTSCLLSKKTKEKNGKEEET